MAPIELKTFERIARRASDDAAIRVDLNTGELKLRSSNNRFRRVISWFHGIKSRLSRRSEVDLNARRGVADADTEMLTRQAESSSAHNTFIRAIAQDFYVEKDTDEVWQLLAASQTLAERGLSAAEKGLSARLVKQIISRLNEEPCATRREIAKVAHYVADRKDAKGQQVGNYLSRTIVEMVNERPRLMSSGYQMGEECKQALGQRIFDEVMAQAENSSDKELTGLTAGKIMREGHKIADRLIGETLGAEEHRLFDATVQDSKTDSAGTQVQPQGVSQEAAQSQRATLLKKLDIPDRKGFEKGLQDKGLQDTSLAVGDEAGMAKLVNRHTTEWIGEQRLQRWYQKALPGKLEAASVPKQLQEQVKGSLLSHEKAISYQEAKAQTQAIVKDYAEQHYPESLPAQLSEAKLPEEVNEQVKMLIDNGSITDKESLAEHGNRSLADWVKNHRVGKWYREQLEVEGVKFTGTQVIPEKLFEDISSATTERSQLWSYALLKDHARQIVKDHVEEELFGTRV